MNEKQLEIIEKASEIFMRFGIKSVTMDDLAKALGMSKKTIYKHFKDKKDLINKIVYSKTELDKFACENAKANSENAIDELIQISQFVSEMFGQVHSSVFYDLQKYHRKAWDIMENHKKNYVKQQIIQNIKRGISEGLYRENLNHEIVSSSYIATMDAIFEGEISMSKELKFSEILIEVTRFQIRGMANDKGLSYYKKSIKKEKNV